MKALVYVRVSTEEQVRNGYSLHAQEEACYEKGKNLGADNFLVYRDEGITGSILERPGLQSALQACKNKDCRLFLVYDPDRLSRKLAHQLMLAETIEKNGCRLEFVNFDWQDTPEGRLFYSMRGAISEYEKEKFRARSKFGKLAKARRGLLTHDPGIFGYTYLSAKNTLEINREEAIIYRHIVEMAFSGKNPGEIAVRLNDEGIPGPRGGQWYRTTVRRILKNPSYKGTIYLNKYLAGGVKSSRASGNPASYSIRSEGEWIPVSIPVLLPAKKWEKLQEKINKRHRKQKVYNYNLSGLLYCGLCGSSMYGSNTKKEKGKVYRYYICSNRYGDSGVKNNKTCNMSLVNAPSVEKKVWKQVCYWLKNFISKNYDPTESIHYSRIKEEEELLHKKLKDLDNEKQRVIKAYRKGIIDFDEFECETGDINKQWSSIRKRINEVNEKICAGEKIRKEYTERNMTNLVCDNLHLLEEKDRSHLINLLIENLTVYPKYIIINAAFNKKYIEN